MKNRKKFEAEMSTDMKPGDYCEVFNKKGESKGFYFFYIRQNGVPFFVKDAMNAVGEVSLLFGSFVKKQTFKYAKVIYKLDLNTSIEKNGDIIINGIKYSQFKHEREKGINSALVLYFSNGEYEKYIKLKLTVI